MKVITDVNVILSALIRDSTTRKIILNSEFDFYFPKSSLHKIRKYKDYILEKSLLTEEEYNKVLAILASEETMIDVTPTHSPRSLSASETTDDDPTADL